MNCIFNKSPVTKQILLLALKARFETNEWIHNKYDLTRPELLFKISETFEIVSFHNNFHFLTA